ncbi:glycosyltransferase family 2 protein [Terasakiella sp. A23]|uniref:glycosyltransferase family 2 protein n=1 Tax=Terasakiella sp. FCG-A23 TaxID=3080561 RepID=UPI0029544A40|nr:glycosyltransferase family 2 protein [Terasakiella sp. A23]MDV7339728.1 glycosyltransferase family 2 protein [Terasakiella sp. A23]
MTKVSFVVTVYNKAPFLPDVIAALKTQTGDFARQYVFVNDGSSDNSLDVVKAETEGLDDVVIVDQVNQGVAIATNNGIKAADGDYIKLVDADDILAPYCTELLLKTARETQTAFTLGISDEYDRKENIDFPDPTGAEVKVFEDPLMLVIKEGYARVSHCLFEKAYFEKAGMCDERVFSQDHSLFIRLSALGQLSQVFHPVCVSPKDEPGRIMNNEAQVVHDATLALAYHLDDNAAITPQQRFAAQKKILARVWKWAKKHHGAGFFSAEFLLYVMGRAGTTVASDKLIALCAVFRKNASVRRP